MAIDFPTDNQFPQFGNKIPYGYEWEGWIWNRDKGAWERSCHTCDELDRSYDGINQDTSSDPRPPGTHDPDYLDCYSSGFFFYGDFSGVIHAGEKFKVNGVEFTVEAVSADFDYNSGAWTKVDTTPDPTVELGFGAATVDDFCDTDVDLDGIYLKRYGDTVDDADDDVTYTWNEGVIIKSEQDGFTGVQLESFRSKLTVQTEDGEGDVRIEADDTFSSISGSNYIQSVYFTRIISTQTDIELTAAREISIAADQNITLTSTNGAELVNRTIEASDPDKQITNKEYVDTKDQELLNQIIELEEEIDAIAPSVERGIWKMTLSGVVGEAGKMSMYDDNYTNIGSPTGLFTAVKSIWLNEIDESGTPHGFEGVEAGELIELFVQGQPEYGLYEVIDVHDETGGASQWWVIEVSFVRTLETTSTADNGDLIRVKIFNAPEGGSADEFVKKTGDKMTGELNMHTVQPDGEKNFDDPALLEKDIRFSTRNTDTGAVRSVTLFQPGFSYDLMCTGPFKAKGSITSNGNFLAGVPSGTDANIYPPRVKLSSSEGQLDWNGASPRLQWDVERVTIPRPVGTGTNAAGFTIKGATSENFTSSIAYTNSALLKVAHRSGESDHVQYFGRITADEDIVTKKYVDDNAGGSALVDVRTDNPSNPPIGHLWYNKSTNQFLLRIS